MNQEFVDFLVRLGIRFDADHKRILQVDEHVLRANIGELARISTLEPGERAAWARYAIRCAAQALSIFPASIQALYMARGRGDIPHTWTTPAFNLRALTYDCARAAFRSARKADAGAIIFELARVEIAWSGQSLAEYAANVMAAAIAEGYRGPLFLQGDHFQVSASRPLQQEKDTLFRLIDEAVAAGYFNIDVDTSTLVDLSLPAVPEQQALNAALSAELAAYIRGVQPQDVTISIGGEIGEVGGGVSTAEEMSVYMDMFNRDFQSLAPGQPGLSKISINTGSAHGGIVLPDGSLAKLQIDFNVLQNLGELARDRYHMGGVVQHGASTLPPENFNQFVRSGAIEVHLATAFMRTFYETIPAGLKQEMHAWARSHYAAERTPGMTDEQFFHHFQMHALAPFKAEAFSLPEKDRERLITAWEAQFDILFDRLGCANTRQLVAGCIAPIPVEPVLADYLQPRTLPGHDSGLAG